MAANDIVYKKKLLKALHAKEKFAKKLCFNPNDLTSRPTLVQDKILQDINDVQERYALGGNQSGKSNLGGRECSWIFNNEHPYWEGRPNHPLLMIVVGKTHKIVREELWEGKIKPFLEEGTYRVQRDGSALNSVTHKTNGNRILFFSHKSPEECRQSVQAFVADWVWLDEMPSSYKLLTELHMRVQANAAPFLATFTPLLRNVEIKDHIEQESRFSKKYILRTYDNPVYTDERLDELKEKHGNMSEAERLTRTEGEWYLGDNAVYDFRPADHIEELPDHYDAEIWRHIECVDPAASGLAGYALLAEDPNRGVWYTIHSQYVSGRAPSELLEEFVKLTGEVNVVKRICDSHESWFIKEAARHKVYYDIPYKKTQRKAELIKGLQQSLNDGQLKLCPDQETAKGEFISCQWNDAGDKIINFRHYHVLDCLQYAVDGLPPYKTPTPALTWHQELRKKHRDRVARESRANKQSNKFARISPIRKRRWK